MLNAGQKVLIAVSGGADSVCLLHLLYNLREELQINLHIAHLDHQLRGRESAADARFVKDLARKWGIPATLKSSDVMAYQIDHHVTLEEAARNVRYTFLSETAQAVGAAAVAIGHSQNDQVETILLHIIRGTGTVGLQGLRPALTLHLSARPLTVIRPLLEITRSEIEEYCSLNDLSYRQDASNLSPAMLRNRVRLELLPLLGEYNSDIAGSLLRISRIAQDEAAYLEAAGAGLWDQFTVRQGSNIIIDKGPFLNLMPAIQRLLLRRAIAELRGNLKDIETRHIEAILGLLNKPAGRKIHLPENIIFSIEYSRFIIGRDIQSLVPFPELGPEETLQIPGQTNTGGWLIESLVLPVNRFSADPESRDNWRNDGFTADFDAASAGDKLILRSIRPGDVFQPLGLTELKKVARFMLDARIPHDWRSRVPLVCSPRQIVWVAGWRIDDRVKVTPATRSILRLMMTRTAK